MRKRPLRRMTDKGRFGASIIYFRNNGGGLIAVHAEGASRLSSVQWQCGLCLEVIDYDDSHDELEAANRHAAKHNKG